MLKKIFKNRNWKVRLVQFVNHGLLLYVLFFVPFQWPLFLGTIFVWFVMFCIGIDIGVHRYFTHRSFKASPLGQWIMLLSFNISTVGSTLAWVGMHREHHHYSDTDKDPHSPVTDGSFLDRLKKASYVYFGVWQKYIAHPKYIGSLKRDPIHKFAHNYYILFILTYVGILSIFGLNAVIYLYCFPAVLVFHSASFIVVYGHIFGKKTFDNNDHSRDSLLLHFITWGEGLHNHHHKYPSKYRFKDVPWYFFDLPGFIIEHFFSVNKKRA